MAGREHYVVARVALRIRAKDETMDGALALARAELKAMANPRVDVQVLEVIPDAYYDEHVEEKRLDDVDEVERARGLAAGCPARQP